MYKYIYIYGDRSNFTCDICNFKGLCILFRLEQERNRNLAVKFWMGNAQKSQPPPKRHQLCNMICNFSRKRMFFLRPLIFRCPRYVARTDGNHSSPWTQWIHRTWKPRHRRSVPEWQWIGWNNSKTLSTKTRLPCCVVSWWVSNTRCIFFWDDLHLLNPVSLF